MREIKAGSVNQGCLLSEVRIGMSLGKEKVI